MSDSSKLSDSSRLSDSSSLSDSSNTKWYKNPYTITYIVLGVLCIYM